MAVLWKSGDFRHKVDIQVPVISTGAIGGEVKTWNTVATVMASITPMSGSEKMAAMAIQSTVSHTIMIRWKPIFADPKLMATMRAVYKADSFTRYYNIHDSANVEERNRVIVLTASEGMNNG